MNYASGAWLDVDGDTLPDMVMFGLADCEVVQVLVQGATRTSFADRSDSLLPAGVHGLRDGAVVVVDADHVGGLDLFVTGYSGSITVPSTTSYLLLNSIVGNSSSGFADGSAAWLPARALLGYRYAGAAAADLDNNGWQDIVVSGRFSQSGSIAPYETTSVLLNNGSAFVDASSVWLPLDTPAVVYGSVVLADWNNDGFMDVLIHGQQSGTASLAVLRNTGAGFVIDAAASASIAATYYGMADAADYDGDGMVDLVVVGTEYSGSGSFRLYKNSGVSGSLTLSFTQTTSSVGGAASYSRAGVKFVKLGPLPSILASGANSFGNTLHLHWNNGNSTFTDVTASFPTSVMPLSTPLLSVSDANEDGFEDLLFTGTDGTNLPRSYLLYGISAGMTDRTSMFFPGGTPAHPLYLASMSWGDLDQDGVQELVVIGNGGSAASGMFVLKEIEQSLKDVTSTWLTGITNQQYAGDVEVADLNGDKLPDVAYCGYFPTITSGVYMNFNKKNFVVGQSLIGLYYCVVVVVDVNGDGFPEILESGWDESTQGRIILYNNVNGSVFTDVSTVALSGFSYPLMRSVAAVADVDGDGAPDLYLSGRDSNTGVSRCALLRNIAAQNASWTSSAAFEDRSATLMLPKLCVQSGAALFVDLTADGHPDLLLSGNNYMRAYVAQNYSGAGWALVDSTVSVFNGLAPSGRDNPSISAADVRKDNYPDVLICGSIGSAPDCRYYDNENGVFYDTTSSTFRALASVSFAAVGLTDFTGDGVPDAFLTGQSGLCNQLQAYVSGFASQGDLSSSPSSGSASSGNAAPPAETYHPNSLDKESVWIGVGVLGGVALLACLCAPVCCVLSLLCGLVCCVALLAVFLLPLVVIGATTALLVAVLAGISSSIHSPPANENGTNGRSPAQLGKRK